jgi:restriction endonuclease S subunit
MEYTSLKYSELLADDASFRIDAEHYKQEYLQIKKRLLKIKSQELINFIDRPVMTGHTPSMKNERFYGGNFNFIKTDNLREHYIDGDFTHKLSEEGNKIIKRSSLKENDVLVTIIGATFQIVGRACLVKNKDLPANINQNIALIRVSKRLSPEYLTVYLNSYYGRNYLWYLSRQTEQVNLNCREIEKLLIPAFSLSLTSLISNLHKEAYSLNEKSEKIYLHAEQILLSELGLLNWKPRQQLSFIKNFSDTQAADRIDAEYFQPMYNEIVDKFQKNYDCDILENLTMLIGHPSNPPYANDDSKNKTFIITQRHLGNYFPSDNFWEDSEALYTIEDFIKKNKRYILQKKDIILYSVGAYIGKANIYNSDIKATIGSFLTLIRPDQQKINPYYLLVFLNSEFGKQMTRRCSRGMAQQYVYPFDIKEFVIPLISKSKQTEIEKKMLNALDAKTSSKRLLNIAKRGVELAIEKSEKDAEKWIAEEMNKK